MLERFDPDAARSLFFARKAVREDGGTTIDAEHLLIGVLDPEPEALRRSRSGDALAHNIRKALVSAISPGRPGVSA